MNISFALTQDQIRLRIKTHTRRLGWENLKVGQLLQAAEKCQGLGKGGKIKIICTIRVTEVRRERLGDISLGDVIREGFLHWTQFEFVAFFCRTHKKVTPDTIVTVIVFEYVD